VNVLQPSGQVHFRNILFATDFLPITQLALPYAMELAGKSGGKIYVVHVISPGSNLEEPLEERAGTAQDAANARKIQQGKLDLELKNIPHEFLFPAGGVCECLSRIIEEKQMDLLVLGTHARAGISKTVFGSVAERMFRQAACPVLTVGPRVSFRDDPRSGNGLQRILYATDFSPESLGAARFAIYLAKEFRARLVLMKSILKPQAGEVNSAYETLREIVPLGAGLAAPPMCKMERGTPAESILGVSLRENADMIVLGICGAPDGGRAAHFANSIAYKVVTQAECPVLTVRA
jgi:nucleotide-binding universal stress UspA family protein